jgi:phage baseplate assembly protein W
VADFVYDPTLDMWPDLKYGRIVLSPTRIGMDRVTGKVLTGWDHVVQSMLLIFSTRFHERVLRRWVGSFVPHMIGNNATEPTITRFYWAIATGLDLWEPNYRIQRVRVGTRADGSLLSSSEELRTGRLTTSMEGTYRPRGHLRRCVAPSVWSRRATIFGSGSRATWSALLRTVKAQRRPLYPGAITDGERTGADR